MNACVVIGSGQPAPISLKWSTILKIMQQLFISRPVSTSFCWVEGGRWWWKRHYTSIAVFFCCTVRMQFWVCPPFLHSQAIPLLYEVLEFDPRFFVSDDLAFVGVFSASYLVNTFAYLCIPLHS
ncbi:hypothetical protein Droror1_Dr00026611 [Drosera rotundifolia]